MRSAKFTAPEKEVEKTKTVQLDQNTVNKRIGDFKLARGACLVPKNRPSLLTQFTAEEILVLGMRDETLKAEVADLKTKFEEFTKTNDTITAENTAMRAIVKETFSIVEALAKVPSTNPVEVKNNNPFKKSISREQEIENLINKFKNK